MLTPLLQQVLGGTPNPVIIELGTCDGRYTNAIWFCCPTQPKITSFEPDPRNIPLCRKNLPSDVVFVPAAVGNVTGKVTFYMAAAQPNGEIGSSSISPFKDQTKAFPWCKMEGTVEVDSWRLDDYCIQHGFTYVDLIFMDVQGAERLMIEGARKTLASTRYLWTEFEGVRKNEEGTCYEHSSSLERLMEYLGQGWEIVQVVAGDALLINHMCAGNPNPPVGMIYTPVRL